MVTVVIKYLTAILKTINLDECSIRQYQSMFFIGVDKENVWHVSRCPTLEPPLLYICMKAIYIVHCVLFTLLPVNLYSIIKGARKGFGGAKPLFATPQICICFQ